jgi:hypothetical protein
MSRMVDPNESSRISCEEITQILTNRFSNSQQLLPNQGLQESRAAIQQEGNKDRKPSYLADQSRRGIKHQKASSQAVLPEYSRPPQFSNGFVTNQNQIGYPQRDSTQPWNAPHDQPTVVPQPAQPSLAIASNPQPQYLQPKVKPIYSVTKQQLTADLKTSEPQPAPKSYEQQYGNSVMDFAHRPAYNGPSQSYLHQPRDNPSRNTTLLNLQPSVQTIAFLNDQAKPLPAERNQTQLHYKEPDTPPVRTAPQPRSSTPSKNFISEKYLEKEVPVQQILELPKTQITEPKQEHHSSLSSYQKYMKHSSSTMELPSPSSYIDHNTSSHFGSSHTQNLSRINNNFVQMDKQAQVLMHAQPRSDQMDRNRFQMLDSSPPPSFLSRDQHSYRPQNYVKPLVSAPLKQSSDPRYSETLQQPVTRPSFQSITQPPIFHEPLKQYSADKNNSSPEYFRPKATQNVQKFIDETIFNVGGQSQMMTLQTSTNPPIQNAQPPSNQDGSRVPDLAIFSTDDYRDRDRKEYKKIVDMVAGTRDTSNWQQRHRKDQASIFATGWENDTIQLRTLESSAQEMPASVNHSFAAYQGTANVRPTMNSSFKHDASNDWSENQENPVPLKRPLARRSETTQGLFTDGRRSLPQQTKSTLGDRLSEASKKMESSTQSKGFQQRGLFNERRTSSKSLCYVEAAIGVRRETASMQEN